jgi:hypothetical protein
LMLRLCQSLDKTWEICRVLRSSPTHLGVTRPLQILDAANICTATFQYLFPHCERGAHRLSAPMWSHVRYVGVDSWLMWISTLWNQQFPGKSLR